MQVQDQETEPFDPQLQEELSELDMYGDEKGRVKCEITRVQKNGDIAIITFKTPVGKPFSKQTKIPKSRNDGSLLMRILQEKRYGLVAADEIIGEVVKFKQKGDEWEYYGQPSSLKDSFSWYFSSAADIYNVAPKAGPNRLSDSFRVASLILGLPIVSLIAYIILVTGEDVNAADFFVRLMISSLSTLLWFSVIFGISLLI